MLCTSYVVEWLTATGWHQSTIIYHRYRDAQAFCQSQLRQRLIRAVRIRSATIAAEPVYIAESQFGLEATHAGR